MIKTENACVDCQLPCLGNRCPLMNMECRVCDECGSFTAHYEIDGRDWCEDCGKEYINDCFNQLTDEEKCEALGLDYKNIY